MTGSVAYRNVRTGRVVHLAEPLVSMDRSRRWERIDSPATAAQVAEPDEPPRPVDASPDEPRGPAIAPTLADPADSTVAQVNAYLAAVTPHERARVLAAEAAGRNRRGIVRGPASRLDSPDQLPGG